MRLVMISDTHGMHDKLSLPDGDVLIHAGDLCMSGSMPEAHTACEWLKRQQRKFAHVVFIAGNHDFAFERDNPLAYLRGAGRVHYLLNSDITIDGVKFWGSPMTPWFNNWAFNVERGAAIMHYWRGIPADTQVLITHGPPMGILDKSFSKGEHLGCEDLRERVVVLKPRVHVFGHIHGGYGIDWIWGTQFINASVVDETYKVVNVPIVCDIC